MNIEDMARKKAGIPSDRAAVRLPATGPLDGILGADVAPAWIGRLRALRQAEGRAPAQGGT
jgi:hypothetical protein